MERNQPRPQRPRQNAPPRQRPPQRGQRPPQRQGRPPQRPPQRQPQRPPEFDEHSGYYDRGYPPQKPKKKFKAWQVVILVIAILAIIGALFNNDDKPSDKAQDPAKQAQDSPSYEENEKDTQEIPEESEAKIPGIGEEATYKNTIVIVEDVARNKEGSEYIHPDAGNEFVFVKITIKNTGDKPISINPLDFKIRTSSGEIMSYDFSAQAANEEKELKLMDLAGGGNTTGVVAFQVPADDVLVLQYNRNAFSDKVLLEINLQ